mmetsp:Transcript_1218/g.2573  ORF Transcript_1218/g.2573 Transcript_1218/m.2573 type:complete len:239 (+) Transcript_1218:1322-2038(+)
MSTHQLRPVGVCLLCLGLFQELVERRQYRRAFLAGRGVAVPLQQSLQPRLALRLHHRPRHHRPQALEDLTHSRAGRQLREGRHASSALQHHDGPAQGVDGLFQFTVHSLVVGSLLLADLLRVLQLTLGFRSGLAQSVNVCGEVLDGRLGLLQSGLQHRHASLRVFHFTLHILGFSAAPPSKLLVGLLLGLTFLNHLSPHAFQHCQDLGNRVSRGRGGNGQCVSDTNHTHFEGARRSKK